MTWVKISNSELLSAAIGREGNCDMGVCRSQTRVFIQSFCPQVFKPFSFSPWLKQPNIARDFLLIHPTEPHIINYENATEVLLLYPEEMRKFITISNHSHLLIFSVLDMKVKSHKNVKHCTKHGTLCIFLLYNSHY